MFRAAQRLLVCVMQRAHALPHRRMNLNTGVDVVLPPPGATRASASGNPGPHPSVAQLRAVCSVCAQDPNKGVEFLGLIQAGLSSTGADALQALALRCVRQLCAADVLEFYSAWRAVVAFLPTLPAADGTAAEWVGADGAWGLMGSVAVHGVVVIPRIQVKSCFNEHHSQGSSPTHACAIFAAAAQLDLMAHGALDAAAEPEVVGGILDALWLATQHRSAAVRGERPSIGVVQAHADVFSMFKPGACARGCLTSPHPPPCCSSGAAGGVPIPGGLRLLPAGGKRGGP